MPPSPLCLLFFSLVLVGVTKAQQSYVDNKQLDDCDQNSTTTLGFVCNGLATSCRSYLTFRSSPPTYNTPLSIAHLLGADVAQIAHLNRFTSHVATIPIDTLVLVPVNCSCSASRYYQHNSSYVLNADDSENYFTVANNTYQGLTTCQSLNAQNPYNLRDLQPNMRIVVPLRCACPTSNQTAAGFRYLLSYLVTWGNTYDSITYTFSSSGTTLKAIYDANQLSEPQLIYPFTPLLVPLKTQPTKINLVAAPPTSPPPPMLSTDPMGGDQSSAKSSSRKWVFICVGIGLALLLLLLISIPAYLCCFQFSRGSNKPKPHEPEKQHPDPESHQLVARREIDGSQIMVYKYEEVQAATSYFAESNRMKGWWVYRGSFKGDLAAVKRMKGDASAEMSILKKINHSNIVRLSGFCLHEGDTYLVYEYAEKGALTDWLHQLAIGDDKSYQQQLLGWKERVQIACDVADALNYLHNYATPPYIYNNLKSSNILLDANNRAKLSNFSLARAVLVDEGDSCRPRVLQMTRHVIGTHGYMAPEYIHHGILTPKLDVFAMGVLMLELLSGREAGGTPLLSAAIEEVLGGDNVREKLGAFLDPRLRQGQDYSLDLAYSMAMLARSCVAKDPNSRPAMDHALITLSKIQSSSLNFNLDHCAQQVRS